MCIGPDLPDFDTLVSLHQKDPKGYEVLRRDLLQECVIDAPDQFQPMLDDLVWRMNAIHTTSSSPLQAAAAASALMLNSVSQLRDQWVHLRKVSARALSASSIWGIKAKPRLVKRRLNGR